MASKCAKGRILTIISYTLQIYHLLINIKVKKRNAYKITKTIRRTNKNY